MNWLTRLLSPPRRPILPPRPEAPKAMTCTHKHVVIHRRDVQHHHMSVGQPEVTCSCNPGIICPVCQWDVISDTCLVMAPDDVVDLYSVTPPHTALN